MSTFSFQDVGIVPDAITVSIICIPVFVGLIICVSVQVMGKCGESLNLSTKILQDNPHETLAQAVLECLSDPNTIDGKESRIRQATQLIFLNASANLAAIPAAALLEGLYSLSTFPSISMTAAECLVVLSVITPSTWKLVSSSTVFERHCNASSILDIFIRKKEGCSSEFSSIQDQLVQKLHQLSDVDFWEHRSFLICFPRTPFYFAVRTALLDLGQSFSEFSQQVFSCNISDPTAFMRLQALVEFSFKSDWEGIPEKYTVRVVEVLRKKILDPFQLEQLLNKIAAGYSPPPCCHLPDCPSLETVRSADSPDILLTGDNDDGLANNKADIEKAILNVLATVPKLTDSLNYHLPFSVDDNSSELLLLTQEYPEAALSRISHMTSAAITILTGLPNASFLYNRATLLALQTLLQAIATLVRADCPVDEELIIEGLKLLVGENRLVNGVPALFAPIATPLLSITAAMPFIGQRKHVEYMIRSIVKGRTTCEEVKRAAQSAIHSYEQRTIHTPSVSEKDF